MNANEKITEVIKLGHELSEFAEKLQNAIKEHCHEFRLAQAEVEFQKGRSSEIQEKLDEYLHPYKPEMLINVLIEMRAKITVKELHKVHEAYTKFCQNQYLLADQQDKGCVPVPGHLDCLEDWNEETPFD